MDMECQEEFVSGFCRTCNGMQTVCCEYETKENGERVLTFMDCAHEKCIHHAACTIFEEAHRLETEK